MLSRPDKQSFALVLSNLTPEMLETNPFKVDKKILKSMTSFSLSEFFLKISNSVASHLLVSKDFIFTKMLLKIRFLVTLIVLMVVMSLSVNPLIIF